MAEPRVVAVIPARGGSKGVPRKNLQELCGKSLLQHAIACAYAHPEIALVLVSTDDEEIAAQARAGGAQVPLMRPAELGADEVPLLPVVQHLLKHAGLPCYLDTLVLLQPTCPFRLLGDISNALQRLQEGDGDCVLSVSTAERHPFRARWLADDQRLEPVVQHPALYGQRQDFPPAYYIDGSVLVARTDLLLRQKHYFGEDLRGVCVDRLSGLDIDTGLDLELARLVGAELGGGPFYCPSSRRDEVLTRLAAGS